jgi:hypothetical protein
MQPFTFSPWVWRDPSLLPGWPGDAGDLRDDPARGDEARSADVRDGGSGTDIGAGRDLTGYKVEATDGGIGSIDEATYDVGSASIVVDTGPWIFGRKVLLPAGTVQRVDHTERVAYVDRTKDQIKHAPEYDKETFGTAEYRDRVGAYYDDSYRTAPPMF